MQPSSVWRVGGGGEGLVKQRPFGSIWQPSLLQRLRRVFQSWFRRWNWAGSRICTGRALSMARDSAALIHGVAKRATSRRRIVLRRKDLVVMVAPWRALRRGRHGRAGKLFREKWTK